MCFYLDTGCAELRPKGKRPKGKMSKGKKSKGEMSKIIIDRLFFISNLVST